MPPTAEMNTNNSNKNIPITMMNTCDSVHMQSAEFNKSMLRIRQAREATLQKSTSDRARELYERNFRNTRRPNVDHSRDYPQFSKNELCEGPVLGKGAFATVYEVHGFDVAIQNQKNNIENNGDPTNPNSCSSQSSSNSSTSSSLKKGKQRKKSSEESREYMVCNSFRSVGDARYAVKRISPDLAKNQVAQAMSDLATETRILASLQHPYIVQLRAVASDDRFSNDFFIVLDRLYDRLDERVNTWALEMKKLRGFSGKFHDWTGHKRAALYQERMTVAYNLSSALWYLHQNRIIHRDLKPENISFDANNNVKLFDFGLAKELPTVGADEHGLYHFTARTGSPRYMAPEVAKGERYNESCDIYSFAILLWEILALKNAFMAYSVPGLYDCIFNAPYKRPPIDPKWHTSLKKLLHYAWSPMVEDRPKMCVFKSILYQECAETDHACLKEDADSDGPATTVNAREMRQSTYSCAKEALLRRGQNKKKLGHDQEEDSNYMFEESGFWKSVAATNE